MSAPEPHPPQEIADTPALPPTPEAGQQNAVPFPVVGIGASAGGLEAFSQLLSALPDDTGMAFVLIQHLDPVHQSRLSELLSRATRMPLLEVTDGMAVQPNHVYVIPPNTSMTVAGGALRLTPRGEHRLQHLPVNEFFQSLAREQSERAIGVVLSGTGSDGTLGLADIKAAGGVTFAQDKASSKYPGMPQSAADSVWVDFILPPEGIAQRLAVIGRHPNLNRSPEEVAVPQGSSEEGHFRKILGMLRASSGVDFTHYRDTTIRRRIMRRMTLIGQTTLADYARLLQERDSEIHALYRDMLINVTSFFRDPEAFDVLRQEVFPEIVAGKGLDTPIRVWVAGCSTGQEAYSLAIALTEFLADRAVRPPVQVFATDVRDGELLDTARGGLYPSAIEAEVSPERLRLYFTKEEGGYRISKSVRDMCIFARQNLAADPPFSRLDLISCRNVLIYLAVPLQKRLISTFHYALNPSGFLLLGTSETVGTLSDLFTLTDQKSRLFAKKAGAVRQYPFYPAEAPVGVAPERWPGGASTVVRPEDLYREADRLMLAQYAPAGVLLDDRLNILQVRGQTGRYLELAPGEASLNLLKMAREGLFLDLRGALEEARTRQVAVYRQGVRVRDERQVREIDLRVLPVKLHGTGTGCFLVLFEETRPPAQRPGEESAHEGAPQSSTGSENWVRRSLRRWFKSAAPAPRPASSGDSEVERLREELASARAFLQSSIEQKEAANEELRSANEEIRSSNEELLSTNEELESAKEELQSLNEELTTLNDQLQQRNRDLGRINDDMINLLSSAQVAMVLLGSDHRIRRMTPTAGQVLNVHPTDSGRPIADVALALRIPDLERLVTEVVQTVQVREQEIQSRDGHWYGLRVHPYRTADNRIDGAVMVLLDIDAVKRGQILLQEASEYDRAVVETVRTPLLILDGSLRVVSANRAFYEAFGGSAPETEDRLVYEIGSARWDVSRLKELLEEVLPRNTSFQDFEVAHDSSDRGRRTMLLNARRIDGRLDGQGLILLAIEDVTERRQAEEQLRESHDELGRRVEARTAELAKTNEALRAEVAGHKQAEAARKELLQRLETAEEEERQRLARELHDQMGQHLTALSLGLKSLEGALGEHGPSRDNLRQLQHLTDVIGREVHHLALELRPTALDDLGLHTALLHYVETWSERSGVVVDLQDAGLEGVRLPRETETALYRVIQEALTNVLKHARAQHVSLILQHSTEQALAIIEDDGRGFDPETLTTSPSAGSRLGFLGMRERVALVGGTLSVESTPGKGTTVFVRIPLRPDGSQKSP